MADRAAFCSTCGTPVESDLGPIKRDNHSAAVSAAIEGDGRLRFRLGLAAAALGVLLLGIVVVFANRSVPPEGSPAVASALSTNELKPTAAPEKPPSEQHEAALPAVPKEQAPQEEDHKLREDSRVYSVALIVATSEIPPGAKLFAQGRVLSFDYADATRSWRYAIIEDEQQPGKTLMCALRGEEGVEVFSLYHVGEVVAVSGEYLDTAGYDGWPRVALTNCHVAGPQDNVVRPVEIRRPVSPESKNVSPATTPEPIGEPLSFDDAMDQCMHVVRQHFPKLSVWPGPAGLEEASRRLYQQNGKRLLLYLGFDPGMGMEEGNGVATCDVQTSRVILKSIQLGITRYDYNDDGSVAQKSGWSGWQKGMQPIPQSTPSESIPTKQPPQNSGPTSVPNAVAGQNREPSPKATGQFVGNVYNKSANLSARFRISVRDDAGKLSGCMRVDRPLFGSGPIDGRVLGDDLTFSVSSWVGTIKFVGHESNDFVKGSYTVEHRNGQSGELGTFTLQKVDSQGPEGDFNPANCPTDSGERNLSARP